MYYIVLVASRAGSACCHRYRSWQDVLSRWVATGPTSPATGIAVPAGRFAYPVPGACRYDRSGKAAVSIAILEEIVVADDDSVVAERHLHDADRATVRQRLTVGIVIPRILAHDDEGEAVGPGVRLALLLPNNAVDTMTELAKIAKAISTIR